MILDLVHSYTLSVGGSLLRRLRFLGYERSLIIQSDPSLFVTLPIGFDRKNPHFWKTSSWENGPKICPRLRSFLRLFIIWSLTAKADEWLLGVNHFRLPSVCGGMPWSNPELRLSRTCDHFSEWVDYVTSVCATVTQSKWL